MRGLVIPKIKPRPKRYGVRGSKQHVEHSIQTVFVGWFRMTHRDHMIFSIPNGARTGTVMQAIRLKAEGLLSGVPDLFIPHPRGPYSGLFIETKSLKGTVSPEQRQVFEFLRNQGYQVEVYRSLEEGQSIVHKYFSLGRRLEHEQLR